VIDDAVAVALSVTVASSTFVLSKVLVVVPST